RVNTSSSIPRGLWIEITPGKIVRGDIVVACLPPDQIQRRYLGAGFCASAIEDRRVSAVHPPDAGDLPDADRQPPVCHGLRAWLSRQPRSLPPPDRLPPAASKSRGVSTSALPARRTSTSRLGTFRTSRDWPGTPPADGVRHSAELLASDLPALLPRCTHGEL